MFTSRELNAIPEQMSVLAVKVSGRLGITVFSEVQSAEESEIATEPPLCAIGIRQDTSRHRVDSQRPVVRCCRREVNCASAEDYTGYIAIIIVVYTDFHSIVRDRTGRCRYWNALRDVPLL